MPSLTQYKALVGNQGKTIGEIHKKQSDEILEATWWNDIQSRVVYLYDYKHDETPSLNYKINSSSDINKIPVDAKLIVNSNQSLGKSQVEYHLMFKPSYECNVVYYNKNYEEKYGASFPDGLYVDIPDSKGYFRRWLIVGKADAYDPQFVTYMVLPCNWKAQWVFKNEKYEMWGCIRKQSSYNSGVSSGSIIEDVADKQQLWLPQNEVTSNIYYNQRMIISAPLDEPITWRISKIDNISPLGINQFTFVQDKFNQHNDYIEKDDFGNVIGMWADYYTDGVTPTDYEIPQEDINDCVSNITSKITYSGNKPEINIGGSYKKYTVTFYNNEKETDFQSGDWSFAIKDSYENIVSVDELDVNPLTLKTFGGDSTDVNENQIKVKFADVDKYLGSILLITYTSVDNITSTLEVKISSI